MGKRLKKKTSYSKICRRCNDPYNTPGKYSKICEKCRLPAGNKK